MKRFAALMLALLLLLGAVPSALADGPHTHVWMEVSRVDPTCTAGGNVTYVCSCGARKFDILPALGHEWSTKVYTGYADCIHYGVFYWVCSRCGAHSDTGNDKPLGHDWDGGMLTKAPTETEEGEITYTCKRDPSHTKTEAVPATGPMNPSLKLTLSADYKFGYMWSYYEYYLGVRLNETLTNTGDVPLRVVTSNVKEFGDTMKEGFFINILKPNEQISFSSYHTLQGIWFEMPNGSGYDTGDITFDKITYTPADPKYTGYAALDVYHYGWPTQGNSVDSSKVEPLCKSNTESITVRLPRDGYVEELHGLGVMKTEKSRPANGEYYVPGETIDYVITLTNDSGSSLSNVAVFDSLAGFEPIAAGESLAAGETKQFGYSTVVTEDETSRGTAVNGAVATYSYSNGSSAMPRISNRVYSKAGDPDAPVTVRFDKTKLDAEITLSAEAEEAAQNEQWHEAAEKWNAEVEKLYKLLWEAGDDEARCAVLEERAMFYSSLEALDDKDYENAALRDMLCGVLFKRLAQTAATEVPEVAGEEITLSSSYPDLLEDEPGMELIFGKLKDKHALLSALILAVR